MGPEDQVRASDDGEPMRGKTCSSLEAKAWHAESQYMVSDHPARPGSGGNRNAGLAPCARYRQVLVFLIS